MANTVKESIKECRCAKCQIKKRAPEIYKNIKEYMRKELDKDEERGQWTISSIIRIAQASRPFYFVTIKSLDKNHSCSSCKGGLWTEITCVIQESPGEHRLTLLPFVDILEEMQKQGEEI